MKKNKRKMTLFALLTKKLEKALDKAPIVTTTVMYLSMKTKMKRLTKMRKKKIVSNSSRQVQKKLKNI